MAYCCPKSVRACAIRITRLNTSGVPLDPLGAETRLLTSGFMELSLSPDYLNGESLVTRSMGGEVVIVDNDFDVLLGFNLRLKMCGVPEAALAMLIGAESLPISGMALPDLKRFACRDPLMIEMWSKNVAADACLPGGLPGTGTWVHWLLPRTTLWKLDSDLAYTSGALEFSLSGYGTQNPGWFPSNPDPALGAFPSYVPGDGDLAGWPTGPAPVVPNSFMSLDAWTPGDVDAIRDSGPLVWKCVDALPFPLDDCGYVPTECVEPNPGYELSFVAESGEPSSPPWRIPDPYIGDAVLPQFTDEGVIPADQLQVGLVEITFDTIECGCEGNRWTIVTEGVLWQAEPGGDVIVPSILSNWLNNGGNDVGTMFLNASYSSGTWYLGLNIRDWTAPDGITPDFISQTPYALTSPVVPQDGDAYRLEAFYDPFSFTVAGSIFVRLFVNDVEVGRVSWLATGMGGVGSGFGHLFDTYAPPCEPVGLYGSPVNSAVPYSITITDLGGYVYNVVGDDSNQSGMISDPLGPVNNDGGASGMCLPNGTGAACATDPSSLIPQAQTYNDGTSDYTVVIWPPLITSITNYSASGTGWKVGLTYDLSDQGLALNADCTAGIIFGLDYRDTLAGLVALHGSGVPFPVTSPAVGSAAVTCYNNLYPIPSFPYQPYQSDWGFMVSPPESTPGALSSSVTSFAIKCVPWAGGANGVWPTFALTT